MSLSTLIQAHFCSHIFTTVSLLKENIANNHNALRPYWVSSTSDLGRWTNSLQLVTSSWNSTVPLDRHFQAPPKDSSFLRRPRLCAAKRLCIQGHYRRYINAVLCFYHLPWRTNWARTASSGLLPLLVRPLGTVQCGRLGQKSDAFLNFGFQLMHARKYCERFSSECESYSAVCKSDFKCNICSSFFHLDLDTLSPYRQVLYPRSIHNKYGHQNWIVLNWTFFN